MADINLAQLLKAGVHFGHKASRWNPKMFPYIYTERNNIHILDLVQTAQLLNRANSYVSKAAEQGKTFLFIGTKPQASGVVAQQAKNCDAYLKNKTKNANISHMNTLIKIIQYFINSITEFKDCRQMRQ